MNRDTSGSAAGRGCLGVPDPIPPRDRSRVGDERELRLAGRATGARDEYAFLTADGVCSPTAFRTADLLLAESLWERDPDSLLVPDANYGVVGVLLADAGAEVTMTEASARAAALCEANADRNGVAADVFVASDPAAVGVDGTAHNAESDEFGTARDFDAVAFAPKPYEALAVAKQRLVNALAGLRCGGRVFLAATETAGLNRFERVLEDCGAAVRPVAERDGCRVLEAERPADFEPPQFVTPSERTAEVDGVSLSLVAVPGVFAAGGLDHGTRLLLETADVDDGDRVLDLCCGYGAAGAYAASVADCAVTLTDDDRTATRCAECTLAASDVTGTVVTADCATGVASGSVDTVLCNPPTHAGSDVLRGLFRGARDVLAPGGTVWVVHHADLDLTPYWSGFEGGVVAAGEEHVVLELH